MKIRLISILMATLIATCVFSIVPAFSADEASADTMQIVREKINADKKLLIAVNMGLTEAEAEKFWPLYEDYQEALGAVAVRYVKLIDDYAASYPEVPDEKAGSLLNDLLAIDADMLDVRRAYLPRFREILPDTKVARYYQLENKIQAVVRFDAAAHIPLM